MKNNDDWWVVPVLAKRSRIALRVLLDLIEAGLSQGQCSANDVAVSYTHAEANTVGAVFKTLRKMGFVSTGLFIKATARRKHSRLVQVWELRERWRAEEALRYLRGVFADTDERGNRLLPL